MEQSHHNQHDGRGSAPHHGHEGRHPHTHGTIDPSIAMTERGMWAVRWSFAGLLMTAILQLAVVIYSGSVALLADTIHNFADAATAIPLWVAFRLANRRPSPRFPSGYGRVEDLAGVLIVAIIFASAVAAGYEAILRLLHPRPVTHLVAVMVASVIGFAGNEIVAIFRIRVGKEMNSAALVTDGYHARADGLTSLAVLVGAVGVWLGFPLADPVVGLGIMVAILRIVWESAGAVFVRLLDGIEPRVIDEIRHAVQHASGVHSVTDVRARWAGHRLHAEVNLTVDPKLTVPEGHAVAVAARQQLVGHLPHVDKVTIHVDPETAAGETFHHAPARA